APGAGGDTPVQRLAPAPAPARRGHDAHHLAGHPAGAVAARRADGRRRAHGAPGVRAEPPGWAAVPPLGARPRARPRRARPPVSDAVAHANTARIRTRCVVAAQPTAT